MKNLVKMMAEELVDRPEEVVVTEIAGETQTVLELRVGKGDTGKVIGRDGRTAQSMRTILSALAAKLGKRAHLEIVD